MKNLNQKFIYDDECHFELHDSITKLKYNIIEKTSQYVSTSRAKNNCAIDFKFNSIFKVKSICRYTSTVNRNSYNSKPLHQKPQNSFTIPKMVVNGKLFFQRYMN